MLNWLPNILSRSSMEVTPKPPMTGGPKPVDQAFVIIE